MVKAAVLLAGGVLGAWLLTSAKVRPRRAADGGILVAFAAVIAVTQSTTRLALSDPPRAWFNYLIGIPATAVILTLCLAPRPLTTRKVYSIVGGTCGIWWGLNLLVLAASFVCS